MGSIYIIVDDVPQNETINEEEYYMFKNEQNVTPDVSN